jgi:drug/metabolite transporter (DMT)-like permease
MLTFSYPLVAFIIDRAFYDHPLGLTQIFGMLRITLGTLGVWLGRRISTSTASPA